ncbi:Glycine/sarcosine N-methyltransferase [Maioricimonas rarisocia]|uniref:Glycine/sarcosine N-methyltransferase n=2 Tax=Maioricimonas rarisocia TaxID=2528026 RepID=A0A517ZCT1_9PLAN|nr:Glycine/sarcosine N-methyltransferase [Maioricimonas rarisocia]
MMAHEMPDWSTLYSEQPVEELPWFHEALDPDLERALEEWPPPGPVFLDLGTGPGTQAIELSRRGFDVIGADISRAAIEQASHRAAVEDASLAFIQDDILNSKLQGPFDAILDRGCFHIFDENDRVAYVHAVARLLPRNGLLYLKCFSSDQPGDDGPYRFSRDEIAEAFHPAFELLAADATVYHAVRRPMPQALFCVLQRR